MSGKPMDPERPTPEAELRRLTAVVSERHWSRLGTHDATAIAEYIAEMAERETARLRDEVKRWRSQCPVTAEHVEAAGVTWAHVDAWVLAQPDGKGEPATDGRPLDSWRRVRENPDGPTWQLGVGMVIHRGQALCDVVRFVAPLSGRPAWDILDEMATATPGGDQ